MTKIIFVADPADDTPYLQAFSVLRIPKPRSGTNGQHPTNLFARLTDPYSVAHHLYQVWSSKVQLSRRCVGPPERRLRWCWHDPFNFIGQISAPFMLSWALLLDFWRSECYQISPSTRQRISKAQRLGRVRVVHPLSLSLVLFKSANATVFQQLPPLRQQRAIYIPQSVWSVSLNPVTGLTDYYRRRGVSCLVGPYCLPQQLWQRRWG